MLSRSLFSLGRTLRMNLRPRRGSKKGLLVRGILVSVFLLALYSHLPLYGVKDLGNQLDWLLSDLSSHDGEPLEPLHNISALYHKFRYDTTMSFVDEYRLPSHLLTPQVGAGREQKWESIDEVQFYDADPRLIMSVYSGIWSGKNPEGYGDADKPIPFSWYDWADFHNFNKLIALQETRVNCSFFFEPVISKDLLNSVEQELDERLFDYKRGDYDDEIGPIAPDKAVFENLTNYCIEDASAGDSLPRKFSPGVAVTALRESVRTEVYAFQARGHLLNALANPLSLTVLSSDSDAYRFFVTQDSKQNIIESGLLEKYLNSYPRDKKNALDHIARFTDFVSSPLAESKRVDIEELDSDEKNAYEKDLIHLKESDFEFDALAKIEELEAKPNLNPHELNYLQSLKFTTQTHWAFAPKHFREVDDVKGFASLGRHHDRRFFNGAVIQNVHEAQIRLNSLIRNFQKFAKANGLISWLAHGTLYGYLYNGQMFPWDNDFDVQMPIRHLNLMAQYFNQTLVVEDPAEGNGRFLLDITSSITVRINGNGNNNIDARFIDLDSGLYIDITGLSVSSAMVSKKLNVYFSEHEDEFRSEIRHRDPNLVKDLTDLSLQSLRSEVINTGGESSWESQQVDSLIKASQRTLVTSESASKAYSEEQRYSLNHDLKLYNCRNTHFYTFEMLSPLINTKFHSVTALVPRRYIQVLRNEYMVPRKYGFMAYHRNAFIPELRFWVNSAILKGVMNKRASSLELEVIDSPVNSLKLDEVGKFYRNLARSGQSEVLSALYNSRELSTYRLKEIDLQFNDELGSDENVKLLGALRNSIGTNISSSFKDPYLHFTEKRRLEALLKDSEKNEAKIIDEHIANEMNLWAEALHDQVLPYYRCSPHGQDDQLDFNHQGAPISINGNPKRNNVFAKDPL